MHLIVTEAFGEHRRGDLITDAGEVAKILAGEHQVYVVRIPAPASDTE